MRKTCNYFFPLFMQSSFDIAEDDEGTTSPSWKVTAQLNIEHQFFTKTYQGPWTRKGRSDCENSGKTISLPRHAISEEVVLILVRMMRVQVVLGEDTSGAVVEHKGCFEVI
ncbi:hypothetical protein Patl1_07349 [Pistacia atlantica]|uniref:Uncharacterized protein n=1 Tax=Pistacia atlantica TaxID=434234 RepID=A0ACC1AG66_9ROSI|nr:hypothetical protein Patl1_07349 [Pistacia atlantica]